MRKWLGVLGSMVMAGSAYAQIANTPEQAIESFTPDPTVLWGILGAVLTGAAILYVIRKATKTANRS